MLRIPRALPRATALCLLALPALAGDAGPTPRDAALMLRALQAACPAPGPEPAVAAIAPDAEGEPDTGAIEFGLGLAGWRLAQDLAGGGAIRISRLASDAGMQRIVAELDRPARPGAPPRPLLQLRAERDCGGVDARMLAWREDGSLSHVVLLDASLQPTGRTLALDPPVPAGEDPGGVTVALSIPGSTTCSPPSPRALRAMRRATPSGTTSRTTIRAPSTSMPRSRLSTPAATARWSPTRCWRKPRRCA